METSSPSAATGDGEMSAPATPTPLKRVRCSFASAAEQYHYCNGDDVTPPSSIARNDRTPASTSTYASSLAASSLSSAGTARSRSSAPVSPSILADTSPTLRRSLDASFQSTGCASGGPFASAFKSPWRRCSVLSALLGLLVYVCFLGEEGIMNGMLSDSSGTSAGRGRNSSSRGGSASGANGRKKRLNAKMEAMRNKIKERETRMTTYDDDDFTERSVDETSDSDDEDTSIGEDDNGDGADNDGGDGEEINEKKEEKPGITHEQLVAQLQKDIGMDNDSAQQRETQENSNQAQDEASSDESHAPRRKNVKETTNTPGISEGPRPYYLVYASDEQSRPGVEASIRSVQAHASGPVEFLFVGDEPLQDLPDNIRVHFRQLSEVAEQYHLHEFENDRFQRHGKNTGLNTNHANYVRFVIHKLLPKQSKAMWIDADTIVECDVIELMKNALTNPDEPKNTIAAVPREGVINGLTRRGRKYSSDVTVSFNAGMYIINLDRWREQHMTEMVKRIAAVNRQYGLYLKGSQPPLALVVGENFEHLPQSWNVKMVDLDRNDTGGNRPEKKDWMCLMHWSGPNKPWDHGHEDKIHPEYWLTWGTPVEPEDLDE